MRKPRCQGEFLRALAAQTNAMKMKRVLPETENFFGLPKPIFELAPHK